MQDICKFNLKKLVSVFNYLLFLAKMKGCIQISKHILWLNFSEQNLLKNVVPLLLQNKGCFIIIWGFDI